MASPASSTEQQQPALDLRRFRGLVPVVLGVCACLGLGHLALTAALGPEPSWLEDEAAPDWSYYQLFGSQVAGADWEAEHRREQFPARFGVLLGASTIQRGPLPAEVEARTGMPWLLLGVGGGTGAFSKIGRSLRVLEASGLRPDTLVLGLHPLWLGLAAPEREASSVLDALWFVRHQLEASNLMYEHMQRAREALSRELGAGTWAAFVPSPDPWHPPVEKPIVRKGTAAEVTKGLERHASLGRLEAKSYRRDSPRATELAALLGRLRALSRRVVVVLLPEHSVFRAAMPDEAARVLSDTLESADGAAPELIDLRDSVRDEWFADTYHLTMDGRRALSALLSQELQTAVERAPGHR